MTSQLHDELPRTRHPVDRFEYLQNCVSALRIVPTPLPTHGSGDEPARRRVSTVVDTVESLWSVPPPIDLEAESEEMETFLRQSRRAKHERQQVAVRSSAQKETELTLRLQHAQRQVLQLKHHIRVSGDGAGDAADSVDSERSVGLRDSADRVETPSVSGTQGGGRRLRRTGGINAPQGAATVSMTEFAALQKEMQVSLLGCQ